MANRVKAAGTYIRGGQGRKRKAIAKFAKRLLGQGGSPEIIGQNLKLDLPDEYLEEDTFEIGGGVMPQQLKFVLQNMRVFGHFEHPIFLELVRQIIPNISEETLLRLEIEVEPTLELPVVWMLATVLQRD